MNIFTYNKWNLHNNLFISYYFFIRLVKKYKFLDAVMRSVRFFTMNDWDFKNQNFLSLSQELNADEKKVIYVHICKYT